MDRATFKKIEIRAALAGQTRTIEGKIPFNSPSVNLGYWDEWTEVIKESAFDKTLADKAVVRAFWNHDASKTLGSTSAGTLTLEKQKDGLLCRCVLGESSFANDAWDVISRQGVTTMSFGFEPVKEEWEWQDSGVSRRSLLEVKLFEVSFGVPFPAYEETNASALRSFIREKRGVDLQALARAIGKKELTGAEQETIRGAAESLLALCNRSRDGEPPPPETQPPAGEPPSGTPPQGGEPPEPPSGTQEEIEARERLALEVEFTLED